MNRSRIHTTIALPAVLLLWLLAGCAARMPEDAQTYLDDYIGGLVDGAVDYELVSAQKAAGSPEDIQVESTSPFNARTGRCPVAMGGEELWCVVVKPVITSTAGDIFSRFLVGRQGTFWSVEGVTDMEADVFFLVGCNNWDAAGN